MEKINERRIFVGKPDFEYVGINFLGRTQNVGKA
jgi:hypothetical protein